MKVPPLLSQSIDPSKDVDAQCEARLNAIFDHYGVPWPSEDGDQELLVRLIKERFPRAFELRARSPDKRVKVKNVLALKQLVNALIAGTEDCLTDVGLRMFGKKLRGSLRAQHKKASYVRAVTPAWFIGAIKRLQATGLPD